MQQDALHPENDDQDYIYDLTLDYGIQASQQQLLAGWKSSISNVGKVAELLINPKLMIDIISMARWQCTPNSAPTKTTHHVPRAS